MTDPSHEQRTAALSLIGRFLEGAGSLPESSLTDDDLVLLQGLADAGVVERAGTQDSQSALWGPVFGAVRVFHRGLEEHGTYWYAETNASCLVQFDGHDGATEVTVWLLDVTDLINPAG